MDSKELIGLMEAYAEVYAPQEVDEGLRFAVKRLLGGGKKEAEAPKPESRGEQLRKKYNVGPEKSDTSAKRQILNRSRARAERDERDYGNSKYSKSVAQKSKEAHDRYLKAGYSKYGADDARGSGNKARKRAATLNREEFECIVNALIEEGYDLSSYTYDEMYEICLDEAFRDLPIDKMRKQVIKHAASGTKRAFLSKFRGQKGTTAGNVEDAKAIKSLNKAKKIQGEIENREKMGSDFYQGSREGRALANKRRGRMKEGYDIFDVVLEFLQAEGYAETLEEAEWMMANVIDGEAIDIILGEAITSEKGKAKAAEMIAKRTTASGRAKSGQGANVAMIKHIGRSNRDGLLGTPPNRKVAGSNWPKSYSGLGGTGNKAAKRAAALKKEDFELWVNELVEEGYDLSDYTWDEMYDIYEAEKPFPYEKVKAKQVALRDKGSAGLDRRMKMGAAVRRAKEAEKTGGSQRDAGKGWYHAKEDYVNEAQHARENPEKYEREQAKKSAPVRGERTPMPPRGDKRREDFEKWYAKQMGR